RPVTAVADLARLSVEPDQRHILRRAWPYLRPHRRRLAGAAVVNLAATLANVFVPVLVGSAVDAVLDGDRRTLVRLAAAAIVLVVARMVLQRIGEVRLVDAGELVVRDLRDEAADRLGAVPLRFVEAHRGGDLLQRVTAEIADLSAFVRGQLPDLISLTGYVAFSSTVLLFYSWQVTLLVVVVFAPLMWLIGRRFRSSAEPAYAAQAAAQAEVTAIFQESLQVREQLQIAGAADVWRVRLATGMAAQHRAVRRTQLAMSWLESAWIVQGVVIAGLLVVGGSLVGAGALTVGAVVTFVLASRELFGSVDGLADAAGELAEARVALARLLDLLHRTPAVDRVTAHAVRFTTAGSLAAEHVSYSYGPGRPVLRDVTVSFAVGERVAIVGETGSGKSTLAKLLSGLYVPDSGTVRYAGVDLSDLPYGDLRRRIVLVGQEVHLITGSLADNLGLAPGLPTQADFERAVQELDLTDWVATLPDGFDTDLGPRGAHLSAGERQLVGLIRAALVRPEVVILDEATADIDPVGARRLETAIANLHVARTLIVIAHRQATIDALPRVVRMVDGTLDES
ncbi:MAG TPA: ABC transporter ATP-binding protein, partial [Actinoplanes sp.]|nr:ABC transporter ATP-binding protein [Actinoplanes sp.]